MMSVGVNQPTPTTHPLKPTSPYSRDQLRYRVSQPLESRV